LKSPGLERLSWTTSAGPALTHEAVPPINQPWMATTGDSCFVIETHTLDQYDSCTRYLSSTVNPMLVPSTQSLGITGNQFTVKYPALGRYKATLTLHSGLSCASRARRKPILRCLAPRAAAWLHPA